MLSVLIGTQRETFVFPVCTLTKRKSKKTNKFGDKQTKTGPPRRLKEGGRSRCPPRRLHPESWWCACGWWGAPQRQRRCASAHTCTHMHTKAHSAHTRVKHMQRYGRHREPGAAATNRSNVLSMRVPSLAVTSALTVFITNFMDVLFWEADSINGNAKSNNGVNECKESVTRDEDNEGNKWELRMSDASRAGKEKPTHTHKHANWGKAYGTVTWWWWWAEAALCRPLSFWSASRRLEGQTGCRRLAGEGRAEERRKRRGKRRRKKTSS